jgi:hypothetical protein
MAGDMSPVQLLLRIHLSLWCLKNQGVFLKIIFLFIVIPKQLKTIIKPYINHPSPQNHYKTKINQINKPKPKPKPIYLSCHV